MGRAAAAARRPALPRARRPRVVGRSAVARATRDVPARVRREQRVQTNEVQRCWVLLPVLPRARRSAGVDELRRRRARAERRPEPRLGPLPLRATAPASGGRPAAPLELSGRGAHAGAGAAARARLARVAARSASTAAPVDVTTDEGARLLECFVWADQDERLERLRARSTSLRDDPPELVAATLEELPALLAGARRMRSTLVFQTAVVRRTSTRRAARCGAALDAARARAGRVRRPRGRPRGRERRLGAMRDRAVSPAATREFVGHADFHGAWLDWLA